jgi:hypothetical protein
VELAVLPDFRLGVRFVASVTKGFDAFMKAIGRNDRCYVLEWFDGGEFVSLVVTPASKFEPIAESLGISTDSAPVAARAYQTQIQYMY